MVDLFHQPGFLGTSANFLADMTLVLSIIVAAALTAASPARRYDYRAPRRSNRAAANAILGKR
jgi:hypothetical protein